MKQSVIYLIAVIAMMSAVSCIKEEPQNPDEQSGVRVIELTFDKGDSTKVGISERTPQWQANDSIYLSNGTKEETVKLKASDIDNNVAKITTTLSGTLYAVYPAGAQNGVSDGKIGFRIPASTDGSFGKAHISVAEGTTTLSFKNVVSIFTITTEDATAMVNITSDSYIAGEFKVTYSTLGIEAGSKQTKSVNIISSSAGDKYVAVASGVAFSAFEFTAIKTPTSWAYKKSTSTTTTSVNTMYSIGEVSAWEYANNGSLWAKFSTSASTKVRFSKANMYCDKTSSPVKYSFEANQFDFRHYKDMRNDVAVIGGTYTTTPSGTVGSFYWSQKPSVAYSSTYSDDSVSMNDVFFTNATEITPKVYFIANGQTGVWRTLSGGDSGEWKYLLSERSVNGGTGEGKSYQRATINKDATGIYGLIIYPDNYTAQTTATSYTSSQWTAMEYSGCVFLPAAGCRDGLGVDCNGQYGFYWSSTPCSDAYNFAQFLHFYRLFNPAESFGRSNGLSVRLVTAAR